MKQHRAAWPEGKHVAYGYQLMGPKGRERRISSNWLTEADARAALSARQTEIVAGHPERPADRTFGQVVEEYLAYTRDHSGTRNSSETILS